VLIPPRWVRLALAPVPKPIAKDIVVCSSAVVCGPKAQAEDSVRHAAVPRYRRAPALKRWRRQLSTSTPDGLVLMECNKTRPDNEPPKGSTS